MDTVKDTAFKEVRKWDNEELRKLLKEVKAMSNLDAPRYFKQSKKLKKLFELEKTNYNCWAEQFINSRRAIEVEILHRIENDIW